MSIDKRESFRLDVKIPYYIEPQDEAGHCLHVHKQDLLSTEDVEEVRRIDHALDILFSQQKYIDNGGVEMFAPLKTSLHSLAWLLEQIVQGGDLLSDETLESHLCKGIFQQFRSINDDSKLTLLLKAFLKQIEDYISELQLAFECSIQGKVFMYRHNEVELFRYEKYFKGLPQASKKGNWVARVILLLVEKLNIYEKLFSKLKLANRKLSDSDSWPLETINLAAGGFALYLEQSYGIGDKICCLFKMDQQFIFAQARCVYQNDLKPFK